MIFPAFEQATPEEHVRRLEICAKCPQMKMLPIVGEMCQVCGCMMRVKAKLKIQDCPEGKW